MFDPPETPKSSKNGLKSVINCQQWSKTGRNSPELSEICPKIHFKPYQNPSTTLYRDPIEHTPRTDPTQNGPKMVQNWFQMVQHWSQHGPKRWRGATPANIGCTRGGGRGTRCAARRPAATPARARGRSRRVLPVPARAWHTFFFLFAF